MSLVVNEYSDIVNESLSTPEQVAIDRIFDAVKGKRILDIGIGAGRTIGPLNEVSKNYIGVDYVQEMVDHCRQKHPDVHLEKADGRSMPQFADKSFDLIVFACNGISMVDQEGRLAILREVKRLLADGGYFLFSTCNRNDPQYNALLTLPEFQWTANPAKLLVRAARFLGETIYRAWNRARYKRHEIITPEYAIVNDRAHHYRTMLYFISLAEQRKQLAEIGFKPELAVYDLSGAEIKTDSTDGTLTFLIQN